MTDHATAEISMADLYNRQLCRLVSTEIGSNANFSTAYRL